MVSTNLQADCVGYKTVAKIVAGSIRDLNESDKHEVDVKAMQADLLKLKKEFSEHRKVHEPEVDVKALQADVLRLENELRKLHKQVQLDRPSVDLKSPNTANIHSVANQKLMKELDLFS